MAKVLGAALLLVSRAPGAVAQTCQVKFAKPGCRMSWNDALNYAKMQNGRLLTVEEAKRFVDSCSGQLAVDGETWVAAQVDTSGLVGTCAGGDAPTSTTRVACEGAGTCTAADTTTTVGLESECTGDGAAWAAGAGVFTVATGAGDCTNDLADGATCTQEITGGGCSASSCDGTTLTEGACILGPTHPFPLSLPHTFPFFWIQTLGGAETTTD